MWKPLYRLAQAWKTHATILGCAGALLASNESSRGQALVALGTINLKGNTVSADSFDSSAPDYPGYWTNSIIKAGGDVVTLSTGTNLNLGNASIAGHVRTGPGGGLTLGTNGSVGDLAWVGASTPGIEPGWFSDDANVSIPDVVIPLVPWIAAPGSGMAPMYSAFGTNFHLFAHLITASGNYAINDSGDIYIATNCVVNLKVLSTVTTFAPNTLYVAGADTNAAKLRCYVDCGTCTLGTGDKSQSGLAGNLIFLGTPNCTSLKYSGNGDFAGAFYFPQADFQMAGGGSGIIDFMGAAVVKTVQMNGHYHFHFDEALGQKGLPMPLYPYLPPSCSALIGQNVSLTASPVSLQPFNYQWQFGGTNISDATNSSLALTNVQHSDAGIYQLVITNASGSFTTGEHLYVYDSAVPTVQSPSVSTDNVFHLSVAGVPSFKYALEVSTNLTDWAPITTNASPYIFSDTNAAVLPQQYYRAVYIP